MVSVSLAGSGGGMISTAVPNFALTAGSAGRCSHCHTLTVIHTIRSVATACQLTSASLSCPEGMGVCTPISSLEVSNRQAVNSCKHGKQLQQPLQIKLQPAELQLAVPFLALK